MAKHDCSFYFHTDEKTEKSVNGEDKGDSGVETQNSESNADDECDPLGPNCYYDKSKSFFDNISCDDTRYESVNMTELNKREEDGDKREEQSIRRAQIWSLGKTMNLNQKWIRRCYYHISQSTYMAADVLLRVVRSMSQYI